MTEPEIDAAPERTNGVADSFSAAPSLAPGAQIRAIRSAIGMSQITLAERLNTSQSAIARMESPSYDGHSLSSLRKVSEVLGRVLIVRFLTPEEASAQQVADPAPTALGTDRPKRGRPRKATDDAGV